MTALGRFHACDYGARHPKRRLHGGCMRRAHPPLQRRPIPSPRCCPRLGVRVLPPVPGLGSVLHRSLPPTHTHTTHAPCPPAQADAVDCATQALEKYNIEKDIAAYIKKEFDKKYNPTWHCIVGRNFGS